MNNYTALHPSKLANRSRMNIYDMFLAILTSFHVIANGIWILLNTVPPTWDQSLHIYHSMKTLDYLKNFIGNGGLGGFLRISNYYPPFVYYLGAFFAWIGNYETKIMLFAGTLCFAVSIVLTYVYIFELTKNKRIAFFSAFFFSFFISIIEQSRYFMLDIPLIALCLAGFYSFEKSRNFTVKKYIYFFFIFFCLAMLTKWYACVFFAVRLFISSFALLKKQKTLNQWVAIGAGVFLCILIVAPWYIANKAMLLSMGSVTITPEQADPQALLSLDNLLFYPKLLIMFQLSFVGFIFFIISTILILRSTRNISKRILFFMIIGSYVLFTVVGNKNVRVLFPIMPFVAAIMAYGTDEILRKGKQIGIYVLSFFICYYMFAYGILSFGIPIYPQYKYAINFPVLGWTDIYYLHTYPMRLMYQRSSIPYMQILSNIYETKKGTIRVLILVDHEYLNLGTLQPYLYKNFDNRKNDIKFTEYNALQGLKTIEDIRSYLEYNVDVILVPQHYIGLSDAIREYESLVKVQKYILSGKMQSFEKIQEYNVRGNDYFPSDTYYLYKNTSKN